MLVSPPDIRLDRAAQCFVSLVITSGPYELAQRAEVTFDTVHPRSVRCREDQFDVIFAGPRSDLVMLVWRKVVQDNVQTFGAVIPPSYNLEEPQNLLMLLVLRSMTVQLAVFQVQRGQQMSNPMIPVVRGRQSIRVFFPEPSLARKRLDGQRPKFIHTDHPSVCG